MVSDSDSYIRAGLGDRSGNSGDFVGQEIDLEVRHDFTTWTSMEVGYAHFSGPFTRRVRGEIVDDANFLYCQVVLTFEELRQELTLAWPMSGGQ